jgi:hypothetical protein
VYIDVAQPAQAKILADNADYFLKPGGHVMLVIKAMSIDVTAPATETFKQEINTLKEKRVRHTRSRPPRALRHSSRDGYRQEEVVYRDFRYSSTNCATLMPELSALLLERGL